MKAKISILLAGFMTITSFTLHSQQANKNIVSEKKVVAGRENKPVEEKKDSLSEYENFKTEEQINILKNEASIGELKTKNLNGNKVAQANYDKIVSTLEQKNNALIDKLNNYNATDKNNWELFKANFIRDMEELNKLGVGKLFPPGTDTHIIVEYIQNWVKEHRKF